MRLRFLLKNQTIFMLYGYEEWILRAIIFQVATAIMLNLDNNGLELANALIHEKCPK